MTRNGKPYRQALAAFAKDRDDYAVESIPGGLINQTYKITSRQNGHSYLLQEINRFTFPEPVWLQQNYERLFDHLEKAAIPMLMPAMKYFPGNKSFFTDSMGRHWRVFEFIDGTCTHPTAETISQASETALCFARFTSGFSNFDLSVLHIPIPGFHDLTGRYRQFKQALQKAERSVVQEAAPVIEAMNGRERYAHLFDVLTASDAFTLRVMHHDAKIGNVLFDMEEDMVVCPVDFDTVMPGYIFSDLGDMIRSMTASHGEDSRQMDAIRIRGDYYEAIVSSYLLHMEDQLSEAEKKYIHFAGIVMTCMQALRYLTDHLEGDRYYRVDYDGQNLARSQNQLTLLNSLEKFLEKTYQFTV